MSTEEMNTDPIYVTRPYLPPLEEFVASLREIWDSRILTNEGPFHKKFEAALAEYLGVGHISLFTNGTLALVTALQTLRITGEVITTPFSFVATTHALHWNGITPVFCDIEPDTFNLDPEKIEAAITPKTTAILPVHIYGNPCNVDRIRQIADTYGLKVIYDAAHTFGVRVGGRSLADFGDLSVLSFHATKVFTTFEGGAIISRNCETARRIRFLKNFGFSDEVTVVGPGINAKMTEFQAALGLIQLKYVEDAVEARRRIAEQYRGLLGDTPGIRCLHELPGVQHNYAYFPVLIDKDIFGRSRDAVYQEFKQHGIHTRRYFYPPISHFPTYSGLPSAAPDNLPVTEQVTERILCLPIYAELGPETAVRIAREIENMAGRK
jgi:dTDP-4-amino-4,6-dideoxygalactose transaminase